MQNKSPTTPDHMKHPTQEQWMDYLYGESPAPERAELAAHLQSCSACAAQVARWNSIRDRLDDWKLPDAVKRAAWRIPAGVKWAMAAAFMIAALGIGFGAGRVSGTKALRAEMHIALQQAQQDHRLIIAAVQRLDEARQAEILALRKDLETVAINADNTFKEQQQLIQLAASYSSQPATNNDQ